MTHRYKFDLTMVATVRLSGKNIAEARETVKAAFALVTVEVRVGTTDVSATANRDGSPDLMGNDRSRVAGKMQVCYAFDLRFTGTIEIAAESVYAARNHIADADITAVVCIDGKRVQVETRIEGTPALLEIDGADPKLTDGDLIAVGGSMWRHQDYVTEWLSQFDDSSDYPGFGG